MFAGPSRSAPPPTLLLRIAKEGGKTLKSLFFLRQKKKFNRQTSVKNQPPSAIIISSEYCVSCAFKKKNKTSIYFKDIQKSDCGLQSATVAAAATTGAPSTG